MSIEDDYQRAAEQRAEWRQGDGHGNQTYRPMVAPAYSGPEPAKKKRRERVKHRRKDVRIYGESIDVLYRVCKADDKGVAETIRDLLARREAELIDEGRIIPGELEES